MIFEWFTFGKGIDWIGKLWGRLWKGRLRYGAELDKINNEILTDPLDIARYYIEPECQNINPAPDGIPSGLAGPRGEKRQEGKRRRQAAKI